MSRKIEIELTSARSDGSWTWRVAGAKQPKGVLDGALLPAGAKVGDVVRAEAEFELDGTVITAVLAPPPKRAEPERLQLLGDTRPFEGVTTSLVPKGSRPRRDRGDGGRARPDGGRPERGGRPDGDRRGPADRRGAGREAVGRGGGPDDRGHGGERRPSREGGGPRERQPSTGPAAGRFGRERPGGAPERGRRPQHAEGGRERPGPPRPKRLNPGSVHRTAVLDSLAPEERAIAEPLLSGGIPAVRRALQEENAKAKEEGRPEIKADALLALAEELLPRLKAAEWRDRAEAAAKDVDELGLRDLRSIVAGSDAGARDDESRILAKTLREALDRREAAEREAWIAEISTCLDEGKVTRALRVAGRPPDPRTRFPAELMTRLGEEASKAMAPDTPPDRWSALLAALLESPVRRSVRPVGLPTHPGESLLSAARQAAGRVPALAALLGLDMPPPPGPPRPGMRPPRPAGPRPAQAPPTGEAAVAHPPVTEAPTEEGPPDEAPVADAAVAEPAPGPVPDAPPALEAHTVPALEAHTPPALEAHAAPEPEPRPGPEPEAPPAAGEDHPDEAG